MNYLNHKIKKVYKEKACEIYQNLSKKEKEKKQQYGRERYRNVSENEEQNLLSMEKILQNENKRFFIIIRNSFN